VSAIVKNTANFGNDTCISTN